MGSERRTLARGDSSGYDPNLTPESRMAYPSRGLTIETIQTLMPQADAATCCTRVKASA